MWGLHDTATLGDRSNPFLLNAYLQYRGEPFAERSANPEGSPATTLFNLFSGLNTGRLTGDLGQVEFGSGFTPLLLKQQYFSSGANLDRVLGRHEIKFGWDFQSASRERHGSNNRLNQLFATTLRLQPVWTGRRRRLCADDCLRANAGRQPDSPAQPL